MPHPPLVTSHCLPCETCAVLTEVWCDLDAWLDGSIRVRCVSHRTATSTP